MGLPADQAITVIHSLGPKLQAAGLTAKLISYDHNWNNAWYPVQVLNDAVAFQYVAGAAFHCYGGSVQEQSQVWQAFPTKELHFTECSGGAWSIDFGSNLEWQSQNLFLGSVRQHSRSVLTWSLALDPNGGPNNGGGCTDCRGVVTVALDFKSVHYEVEWYGMGHYSKFLTEQSFALNTTVVTLQTGCLDALAFSNGPEAVHVIAFNFCGGNHNMKMAIGGQTMYASVGSGLTTFNFPASSASNAADKAK